MDHKDYYKILGLSNNASIDGIKKAYRKLAMQCHPDRNPGNEEWANEKFKEVHEAFSVLGDPEKKKQYDQFGTAGTVGDIFASGYTRTTLENLMQDIGGAGLGFDFLDDIFDDSLRGTGFSFRTFERSFGGRRGTRFETPGGINLEEIFSQAQRLKRENVHYEISITGEEAARGVEKDLMRMGKKLRVNIPAGVRTGNQVRLRNARKVTDGQPGDILITVKVLD